MYAMLKAESKLYVVVLGRTHANCRRPMVNQISDPLSDMAKINYCSAAVELSTSRQHWDTLNIGWCEDHHRWCPQNPHLLPFTRAIFRPLGVPLLRKLRLS